jgi:hypothetical protein
MDLVDIVLDLRNKGILDPSYLEIAQVYFRAKIFPTPQAQPIKDKLETLLHILRYTYGHQLTHCLGRGWYYAPERRPSFRQLPPVSEDECGYCSPMGRGRGGRWGIRFAADKDDRMWLFMNNFHRRTSASSFRHGAERFALGMEAKLVSKKEAKPLIKASVKLLVPGNFKAFGDLGFNGDPPPFDNRPRKK